jgi:3-phosphoshikimate 1-carboxyvinyltransferase
MTTNALTLAPIRAVSGEVNLPGSKSLSNRALLLAALAHGETSLNNLLFSDDTARMMTALTQLGIHCEFDEIAKRCNVVGGGGPFQTSGRSFDLQLGNAGTAVRPLVAMLALSPGDFKIDGDHYMRARPIGDLTDALVARGVPVEYLDRKGYLPLTLRGGHLTGGAVRLKGSLSSQYLTALLMALPLASESSSIDIEGDLVSKPYIDMTLAMMAKFGVIATHDRYQQFQIAGGQQYQTPGDLLVEGDASTASYFLAAGALRGEITVTGVGHESLQGDVAFAAVFAEGTSTIRNIYNWRIKETDRMTAMASELTKVGASVSTTDDSIRITPPKHIRCANIKTYGDHRMAMCFSLLAFGAEGIVISNPEVTQKTFPRYFEVFDTIATPV